MSLKSKAPNLVFKPSATINTCYDDALPSKAQLMIVNAGDDTARNTKVSIFQTANTRFWGGNRSAIDTSSLVTKIGKSGRAFQANITKVRLNLNRGALLVWAHGPSRLWISSYQLFCQETLFIWIGIAFRAVPIIV